mmetsp:Transcript_40379/g.79083  ORF Transcript_40379/g.79083 Transcript_40379/m.79083 type:complete len:243 (+) Transcript_40379:660-1388(+)
MTQGAPGLVERAVWGGPSKRTEIVRLSWYHVETLHHHTHCQLAPHDGVGAHSVPLRKTEGHRIPTPPESRVALVHHDQHPLFKAHLLYATRKGRGQLKAVARAHQFQDDARHILVSIQPPRKRLHLRFPILILLDRRCWVGGCARRVHLIRRWPQRDVKHDKRLPMQRDRHAAAGQHGRCHARRGVDAVTHALAVCPVTQDGSGSHVPPPSRIRTPVHCTLQSTTPVLGKHNNRVVAFVERG